MDTSAGKKLWLDELWDEWLGCQIKNHREAEAECAGLFIGMLRNKCASALTTNRLRVARRLLGPGTIKLWSCSQVSKNWNMQISTHHYKNQKPFVKFSFASQSPDKNFLFYDELFRLSKKLRLSWSWLRGLWGSSGGFYFPKSGYFLSLIVSNENAAALTKGMLERTGLSWTERRNEFNLRKHDDIVTFFGNMGLTSAALKLEDRAILRYVRNQANRANNYDAANIARSVQAALEQTELAEEIIENGLMPKLPKKLQELVRLRLDYPEASLGELGKKLRPQIKKSAVKYRWLILKNFLKKNRME